MRRATTMIISAAVLGVVFVVPPVWLLLAARPGQLPRASCGSVGFWAYRLYSADRGALTCFGTAARACKPASIGVRAMSTDFWTDYVFTIESGGTACHVFELSQDTAETSGAHPGGISSGACLLTTVTRRDVMLACAGQQVLIPASAGEPISVG
jgi:hypothetical protein